LFLGAVVVKQYLANRQEENGVRPK
jgi:hypothetical protein